MNICEVLSGIRPVDIHVAEACQAKLDQVAKPVGSLGRLEGILTQIAAITGSVDIDVSKKAVAVFCADNGVVKHGVALHDCQLTTAVAEILGRNTACVSVMAQACGAEVFVTDVGMVDTVNSLHNCKLMKGTNDITEGPAMSREIAEKAVKIGIDTVKKLKDKGYNLIATGELGMGNTTTSAAVCAVLLNRSVREVTGRGAGLDDAGLLRKIDAIEKAISINKPEPDDPMNVLYKVGGLDIAAMAGIFLGGALYRIPVVMDGFISGTAALVAVRLCPHVRGYILPSHQSDEPGAQVLTEELELSPIIQAGMRLGEGTGAVTLFPIIDVAVSVYQNAAVYADIKMGKEGGGVA